MSNQPRILVIDCYLDEVGGARNVTPHFENCGVIRAAHEPIPEVLEADGLVITGSAASLLDPPEWSLQLSRSLARAADTGTTMLGLCFGHQLIARTLFGESALRRALVPEMGWGQIDVSTQDELLQGVTSPFRCFLSHKDEVNPECDDFRTGALVLAHSQNCPVEAFRAKGRPLWGVQFHSEIGLDESRRLVLSRLGADSTEAAQLLKDAVDTTELAARIFSNFLEQTAYSSKK